MEILPVKRAGMLTFAGVILVIAGSFNLLDGIVALTQDEYFRADELLFGDLSAWASGGCSSACCCCGRASRSSAARSPALGSASGSPG